VPAEITGAAARARLLHFTLRLAVSLVGDGKQILALRPSISSAA
jgi:hypothetical protein